MKKVLIIAIIGLLFASCEKDEPDYREKFAGRYSCIVERDGYERGRGVINKSYLDTIEVGMVDDSSLTFFSFKNEKYFENKGAYYLVDKEGNFALCKLYDWDCQITGRFFNDSVLLQYSYDHNGMIWFSDLYKGKKIKQ